MIIFHSDDYTDNVMEKKQTWLFSFPNPLQYFVLVLAMFSVEWIFYALSLLHCLWNIDLCVVWNTDIYAVLLVPQSWTTWFKECLLYTSQVMSQLWTM